MCRNIRITIFSIRYMSSESEIIYSIALSQVKGLNLHDIKLLVEQAGSATEVYEHRREIKTVVPEATNHLAEALLMLDLYVDRAKRELEFATKKHITPVCLSDERYPERLRNCVDAPSVFYFMGNGLERLNAKKIISIVGTRRCTQYGKDICRNFVSDLQRRCPDILVVSGLAYGIDINAHRAALASGLDTVAVLAHGLDRIYPQMHRNTAVEMLQHGGLVTEYMSGTTPEKFNFVRRNRIVAGLADATIIVESANKGGSLITADLANSYNRDVFAFPGRINDQYSEGCNRIIYEQRAVAIRNADDLMEAMCWENPLRTSGTGNVDDSRQLELFHDLTEDEMAVVRCLQDADNKMVNQIIIDTGFSYSKVSAILFSLEIKERVMVLGGARYKLLQKL